MDSDTQRGEDEADRDETTERPTWRDWRNVDRAGT